MALIVNHLQDKKSVYLQDKDGNEVEFIRADILAALVNEMESGIVYPFTEDRKLVRYVKMFKQLLENIK